MSNSYYEYLSFNGAELFTVVCTPEVGGKYPTVIYRTPYASAAEVMSEKEILKSKTEEYSSWTEAGYTVVFQHCRGMGKSTGDCVPYINEREDSLFLEDWVRKQDFYNGEIYLWGISYTASVHLVSAPFAADIKGAVFEVQDCERYNCNYRNGFYKVGLHGGWYVGMYKRKRHLKKSYTADSYRMLPLSNFSKTVFGESAEDFDEVLRHPRQSDSFWDTRLGGGDSRDAIRNAKIPILLVTGFYDLYTGGIFDMWHSLGEEAKERCALAVHPFDHVCNGASQPINFENGTLSKEFPSYQIRWFDWLRGKCQPPFATGKVTYYKLFDGKWCCDDFCSCGKRVRISLGEGSVSYRYNPYAPASFKSGLSANSDGCAWQDPPSSRYDIISLYTPEFEEDTFIKGKIGATLSVSSDCEDTCFYMRLSLCTKDGYYGLRDDINQISNFDLEYKPGDRLDMPFSFDEHAFVVKKGEKIRIDISSSAWPHYVPHTNQRGLFSEQTQAKIANNTVHLGESYIEIPVSE